MYSLSVFLCEILAHAVEAAEHALTDGDARHYDDELRPAIELVQLEHRLDIGERLARSRLHLDGQRAAVTLQLVDGLQTKRGLHPADVVAQRHAGLQRSIGKALCMEQVVVLLAINNTLVNEEVARPVVVRLTQEAVRHGTGGILLETLVFIFEFHSIFPSFVFLRCDPLFAA